jgi:hypothetical protein
MKWRLMSSLERSVGDGVTGEAGGVDASVTTVSVEVALVGMDVTSGIVVCGGVDTQPEVVRDKTMKMAENVKNTQYFMNKDLSRIK